MSRFCPELNRRVLYTECLECDTKSCKKVHPVDFIRRELYWDYLMELEIIKGEKWKESSEEMRGWCESFLTENHYDWIDIECNGIIVGFLIMAVEPDCHPDCDYFVCQSYVKPSYRHQGLMSEAVREYERIHSGTKYCMFILNKNRYAYKFWHNLFKEMGYDEMDLRHVIELKHGESQYGFRKSNHCLAE